MNFWEKIVKNKVLYSFCHTIFVKIVNGYVLFIVFFVKTSAYC